MATKILEAVPHFSQLDNKFNPGGTCNLTSVAMVLWFYGIRGDGSQKQLEDQLFIKCAALGLDYHAPYDMQRLMQSYGIKSNFTPTAKWKDARAHIDAGKPLICHGYFTRSGHIVTIVGYDDNAYGKTGAWVVNDPFGEWFSWGYNTVANGKWLRYSYRTMRQLCGDDGDLWLHFCTK